MKTNGGASHTKDVTLQSLLLAALLVVVLAVGAGFTVRETNQYAVQALECFRGGQEKLLTQVRRDVEAGLYADQAQAIEALKRADASGSRHWFLYDSGGVLFERSETVTAEVSDMALKQLADLWKIRGGERVDDLRTICTKSAAATSYFKDAKRRPGARVGCASGGGDRIISGSLRWKPISSKVRASASACCLRISRQPRRLRF